MRKNIILAGIILASTATYAQQHQEMAYVASTAQLQLEGIGKKGIMELQVSNPNATVYKDAPVCVKLPADTKWKAATVWCGDAEIPSQLDDLNADGIMDELALVIDLDANESKMLKVVFGKKPLPSDRYESRVFATMRRRNVKKGRTIDLTEQNPLIDTISCTSDAYYNEVFPHGLCFENELMGYRVYFRSDQGTDLYGKRVPQLELERSMWYTPEIRDSAAIYNYGEDYIIVGQTATLGTLRGWDDSKDDPNYVNTPSGAKLADPCMQMLKPFDWRQARIVARGPVRTVVDMNVEGWEYKGHKLNSKSRYILYAGNREHQIVQQLQVATAESERVKELKSEKVNALAGMEFVTGVMKVGSLNHDSVDVAINEYMFDGKGLCASYGKDWPDGNRKNFPYMSKAALAVDLPEANVTRVIDRREQILYGVKLNADGSLIYRAACAAPDLETFAPTADGRWDYLRWFEWVRQWKQQQPVVVEIADNK